MATVRPMPAGVEAHFRSGRLGPICSGRAVPEDYRMSRRAEAPPAGRSGMGARVELHALGAGGAHVQHLRTAINIGSTGPSVRWRYWLHPPGWRVQRQSGDKQWQGGPCPV